MHDWLTHRVVSTPDAIALIRAEDGESWTYAALDRLVSAAAGRLAAHGVTPGDHLGVFTTPTVDTVVLAHAAMRVGATFVPLGRTLTARECRERADRVGLDAAVCSASTEAVATEAVGDVPLYSLDDPRETSVRALGSDGQSEITPHTWRLTDRLCVLFTSGTTGKPKAVPLTVGNVGSSAIASAFRLGVDPADRWLVTLAFHHTGGLAPVYRSVLYGTTVVLRAGFDAEAVLADLRRHDVTGVSLVPTMLARLLDETDSLAPSLRAVLLGGAPASTALVERSLAADVPIFVTYGMTETASQVATARPETLRTRGDTVGRPVFGTTVQVVDDDGLPVAPGETGEIVVHGPTVTPGDAAEGATESPDQDGLHTGDLGRLDEEGYLYVHGRVDDRIVTGGENVDPSEVADALCAHPAVNDAAVLGLPDDEWGERVAALVAVTRDGAPGDEGDPPIDEASLLAVARERLASFKLPKTLAYVDALPRTVSGTVDREAVRTRLADRDNTRDTLT